MTNTILLKTKLAFVLVFCVLPARGCQDIIWTLLFIVFIIGTFVVLGWAQLNGEPERYINGAGTWKVSKLWQASRQV